MILLVKLFHLIYTTAIYKAEDSSHFYPYIDTSGEDTWYSKTFEKHKKVVDITKLLRDAERLEK